MVDAPKQRPYDLRLSASHSGFNLTLHLLYQHFKIPYAAKKDTNYESVIRILPDTPRKRVKNESK